MPDIISSIIFLGLVQGIFLSVIFMTKKEWFYKILSILLLIISIQILDFYAAYRLITLSYPHLLDISVPLGLWIGPIFYFLYHQALYQHPPRFLGLHFLSAIIYGGNHLFFYFQSAAYKYNILVSSRGLEQPLQEVITYFPADPLGIRTYGGIWITCSLFFYLILVIRLIAVYNQTQKIKIGEVSDPLFNWLRKILIIFIGMESYLLFSLFYLRNNPNYEYITAILLTIIIYYTSYMATVNSMQVLKKVTAKKYEKSTLPPELRAQIKSRLLQHLKEDKAYLSNTFSLQQLANNLSTSPNYLSQIINQDFGQNYHEFIAHYRITAAKEYLQNEQLTQKSIEEISFMVGYNSKSAFNKAFKKLVGQTPLQYKKAKQNS